MCTHTENLPEWHPEARVANPFNPFEWKNSVAMTYKKNIFEILKPKVCAQCNWLIIFESKCVHMWKNQKEVLYIEQVYRNHTLLKYTNVLKFRNFVPNLISEPEVCEQLA